MGVLGLTRWANESERLVSSELTLPIPSEAGKALENGEPVQLNSEGDWLVDPLRLALDEHKRVPGRIALALPCPSH